MNLYRATYRKPDATVRRMTYTAACHSEAQRYAELLKCRDTLQEVQTIRECARPVFALEGNYSATNSTHRQIQLSAWNERASAERVAYYCRAIKAKEINNFGAATYFTQKARKWEGIRIAALRRILAK